ncbi:MAG: threonine aldolase family protein [Shimia sp.]
MNFASDNTAPIHPAILKALSDANEGYALGYGADEWTARARDAVRATFEAPHAVVEFVTLGTAGNALALACLTPPWGTTFCHRHAHIHEDECNAPEFYAHGAKLTLVEGEHGKMTPDTLRAAIESQGNRGVHGPARGAVSITQVTEAGTVYTLDEIAALTDVAKAFGLPVHLDGARFANACVALQATAAEMTQKVGVDVVTFGGTKNGCMAVEACVFFDPAMAESFAHRRKRGAHLWSKHRYLSAQMLPYLEGGLWRDLATDANARAALLADGLRHDPRVDIQHPVDANIIFARFPRSLHQQLHAAGATYYVMDGDAEDGPIDEPLLARFVASWCTTDEDVKALLGAL